MESKISINEILDSRIIFYNNLQVIEEGYNTPNYKAIDICKSMYISNDLEAYIDDSGEFGFTSKLFGNQRACISFLRNGNVYGMIYILSDDNKIIINASSINCSIEDYDKIKDFMLEMNTFIDYNI